MSVMVRTPDGCWRQALGPEEPRCQGLDGRQERCLRSIGDHRRLIHDHKFDGGPSNPGPWDIVPALAHTEWTCPHCGVENDVWGDGAINEWMECGGCQREMWLSLDAWFVTIAAPTPVRPVRPVRDAGDEEVDGVMTTCWPCEDSTLHSATAAPVSGVAARAKEEGL